MRVDQFWAGCCISNLVIDYVIPCLAECGYEEKYIQEFQYSAALYVPTQDHDKKIIMANSHPGTC